MQKQAAPWQKSTEFERTSERWGEHATIGLTMRQRRRSISLAGCTAQIYFLDHPQDSNSTCEFAEVVPAHPKVRVHSSQAPGSCKLANARAPFPSSGPNSCGPHCGIDAQDVKSKRLAITYGCFRFGGLGLVRVAARATAQKFPCWL